MIQDDISYYQQRAEIELERAQQSSHPEAVLVHYRLAEAYLDRVSGRESAGRLEDA